MSSQYWFSIFLGAVKLQAYLWANVNLALCHHNFNFNLNLNPVVLYIWGHNI